MKNFHSGIIVILGGNGLLGTAFKNFLRSKKVKVISRDAKDADITDVAALGRVFRKYRPAVVINCAAVINVEQCEREPINAWTVNALGPGNILAALRDCGLSRTLLVQISTSDVFGDDQKSFTENDRPQPLNYYGWSKLGGEKLVEAAAKQYGIGYYILRTSWLYDPHRTTFVDLVVEALKSGRAFKVIADQRSVPTSAADFTKATFKLIIAANRYPSGIYHLTNHYRRPVSKYEIALAVAKIMKLDKKLLKKVAGKHILSVKRPKSAALVSVKAPGLPDWRKSLAAYLHQQYGKS